MSWHVETQHPVAVDSLDHMHPHGTIRDNNSNTRFVQKLHEVPFGHHYHRLVLDIGCAGGAFVKEVNEQVWMIAVGIEGSDINQKTKRAEWATIPENLFTADATKPFSVQFAGRHRLFDIITAWEVMEHFEKSDLDAVMENINRHSRAGTLLICSVANSPSMHDGVDLHRTQEGPEFWLPFFASHGFERDEKLEEYFAPDWVRQTDFQWCFRKKD